jgi:hypothetical protein
LPLDLTIFNHLNWTTTDDDLEYIGDKIESLHHFDVVTTEMIKKLKIVSETILKAGLMGSNEAGLFMPRKT